MIWKDYYVGTEILTAIVMDSTIIWDIASCNPLKATVASIFTVEVYANN
jgi:hypothetical protein